MALCLRPKEICPKFRLYCSCNKKWGGREIEHQNLQLVLVMFGSVFEMSEADEGLFIEAILFVSVNAGPDTNFLI